MQKPYYQDTSCTIYHGDCREVLPELGKFDLLFTSPPYGVGENNMAHRAKVKYGGSKDLINDELLDIIIESNSRLVGLNIQMLAANKQMIASALGRHSEKFKDVVIWNKTNPPPAMEPGVLNAAFEFIFFFGDSPEKRKFTGCDWRGTVSNVWVSSVNSKNIYADQHKATFPQGLPSWVVSTFSPDGIIVDPFMGTGTTLRAAKDLGRKAVGIELEERYCEIAAKRLQQEVFDLGV